MRNQSIDGLRGIAILVMFAANVWPYTCSDIDPPLVLRILFSMAAPTFVFLTGFSFAIGYDRTRNTTRFLNRAIQVLAVAVGIDVIVWGIMPCTTFDVLYAISISQLILVALANRPRYYLYLLILLSLVVMAVPHDYHFVIHETSIWHPSYTDLPSILHIPHAMIWDGWFPLVPWSSLAFLGYAAAQISLTQLQSRIILLCSAVLILGYYLLQSADLQSINPLRNGYTELFYPVTPYFLMLIVGVIFSLLVWANNNTSVPSYFKRLGQASLFAYVLHCVVIRVAIIPTSSYLGQNSCITLGLWIVFLLLIALPLHQVLQKIHARHSSLRVIRTICYLLGVK